MTERPFVPPRRASATEGWYLAWSSRRRDNLGLQTACSGESLLTTVIPAQAGIYGHPMVSAARAVRPMDAGLRRHDQGMAVISDVVTALFADIVNEAAIRP